MAVIFATGATGFIGKEMTMQLVKGGHTVYALIRSRGKWEKLISSLSPSEQARCIGVTGDLNKEKLGLSQSDYNQILTADVMIHAGVPMNILLDESIARDVILSGTKKVLDVAKEIHQHKGLNKFIHVVGYMSPFNDESGKSNEDVFSNTDFMKHTGGYERYKFLADLLVRQEALRENMPLVVVNPSTVIGPRHTGSTEQVDGFGLLVSSIQRGKMPVLPWGREWWLPLVSVDDVAKTIAEIVVLDDTTDQTYYPLNSRETTLPLPDFVQFIAKELRMTPPKVRVPVSLIKNMLHWGGSHLMGVPANSMDFLTTEDFPVQSFQKIKDRIGIEEYNVSTLMPHVIADLDYRLAIQDADDSHDFVRERLGNVAAYKKEGTGNPWVILHGLFSNMDDLLPLAEQLSDEPVWLLDLPGLGRSPYHHQENLIQGYIDTLAEAIKELPSPVHLVGHSFGGYLAWKVAQQLPDKVEQLYLLQPTLHTARYSTSIQMAGRFPFLLDMTLKHFTTPERLEPLLLEQGSFQSKHEIPSSYPEKIRRSLQSPRIRKTHVDLLTYLMRDLEDMDFSQVDVPVKMIWGTLDKVYQLSKEVEVTLRDQKGVLKRLNCAHQFPISHPKMTAELLAELRVKEGK
ncbi:alpha/beta fold hydrolase [Brevibacillus dissolubilis]|uniref:alpha/beta fold hydrolase n=1 Tax=Brevibacillus dissolubilis TaxID=1844116 RepID=UPI0011165894|nr:alpha/beta fold hydrolase [Brevibacillus dissolubilis]